MLRDHRENHNLWCHIQSHKHLITATDGYNKHGKRKTALNHPAIILDILDERNNPELLDFMAVICIVSFHSPFVISRPP
jgi:hypothetical protein